MIKSMTAFARIEEVQEPGRFLLEIKSVNHRYLDCQINFPDWLKTEEINIRKQIASQVKRGKVEFCVYFQPNVSAEQQIPLDIDRLNALSHALETIKNHLPHAQSPSALEILAFPDVVKKDTLDIEPLLPLFYALLDRLLSEFVQSRVAEGKSLAEFVLLRCDEIIKKVDNIEQYRPQVLQRQKDKLLQLFSEISEKQPQAKLDESRMEQELVYYANKLDIAEEIGRIRSHIESVKKIIDEDKAVGRKLDFLMQELNREANTLTSKSQDINTTNDAVELKVLIEQMREQIQNIE